MNLRQNPNTFTVLDGGLSRWSALTTATVDGDRLAGRQMVDVMNILGLDYATFGNHQIDLAEEALLQPPGRVEVHLGVEQRHPGRGRAGSGTSRNATFTVRNADGTEVAFGLFGVTVASTRLTVTYRDPVAVAKEQVAALRGQVDILIAVTTSASKAISTSSAGARLDFVIGGDEHENTQVERRRRLHGGQSGRRRPVRTSTACASTGSRKPSTTSRRSSG